MTFSDQDGSFLTVAEVASLLKLNQQTVRNWIDQGSLPAVRVGRRVRIKRSDLQRVIDQGYQGMAVESPRPRSPSAEDFWGGEPVGMAEIDPGSDSAAMAEIHPRGEPVAMAESGTGVNPEPPRAESGRS